MNKETTIDGLISALSYLDRDTTILIEVFNEYEGRTELVEIARIAYDESKQVYYIVPKV